MSGLTYYSLSTKPIGETIKPYELVIVIYKNDNISVKSLTSNEIVPIPLDYLYTHLLKSYMFKEIIKNNSVTLPIKTTKREDAYLLKKNNSKRKFLKVIFAPIMKIRGLFKPKKQVEVIETTKTFAFMDSPFRNDILDRVIAPIKIFQDHYEDLYFQFQNTFVHIATLFETLCQHHEYLNDDMEGMINDAEDVIKGYFQFAIEVVERTAKDNTKKIYANMVEEQRAILSAYKENINMLCEINNQNKNGVDEKWQNLNTQ